jgi:hypothetical protein
MILILKTGETKKEPKAVREKMIMAKRAKKITGNKIINSSENLI